MWLLSYREFVMYVDGMLCALKFYRCRLLEGAMQVVQPIGSNRILAFHAKILVRKGEELLEVSLNRSDWCSDEEIFGEYSERFHTKLVGELVERMKEDGAVVGGATAVNFSLHEDRGGKVWDWFESVN